MANSIDRLFESVLSRLPRTPIGDDPVWPDIADGYEDVVDRPPGSGNDQLRQYQEVLATYPITDRLLEELSVPEISEEDKELVEGGIRSRGFEAIAFYKSRRFQSQKPFPGKWGIFYINEGLRHVGWQISHTVRLASIYRRGICLECVRKEEKNNASRPLRDDKSRNGGDLLSTDRVTKPVGKGD
ncbi:MAG: hypothetical protein ACK536_09265 [Hyphomonadaceae bacterium]